MSLSRETNRRFVRIERILDTLKTNERGSPTGGAVPPAGILYNHLEDDGAAWTSVTDLNLNDDAFLYFGVNQDTTMKYDEAVDNLFKIDGADWLMENLALNIGEVGGGGERLALRIDQNANTAMEIVNVDGNAAAGAAIRLKNVAGAGGDDSAAMIITGTGYTPANLIVADQAIVKSGANLAGGLLLVAEADVDVVCGVNVNVEGWRLNTTEFVVNDGSVDLDFRVESDNHSDALFIQGLDGQFTIGALGAGYVQADAGGILSSGALPGSFTGFANPTGTVGLVAVNGVATTAMRSDGAPPLSQAIAPTWTDLHIFIAGITFDGASGANEITVPNNTAIAFELEDAGGLEYLRLITTDAQPVAVWNEDGTDVDFRIESNNQTHMFFVDGGNDVVGIRSSAPAGAAAGLHVPWITGDADTTAYFGSTNASNNQIAVEVETYSNIGIKCTAVTGIALVADSASGDIANFREGGVTRWEILNGGDLTAVAGDLRMNNNSIILDNDLDTEISAKSADDQIDITIAGADDFTFTANSLNVLPGSSIYLSEYMYHLGDTNTLMRFQTDRYTLTCGGIQMIDAFETGTNYLNLHAGLVGINETANANMAIGLTIDQAANGDEILNFRSSDVGAVLSKIETGTFLNVTKAQGDSGGATIHTLKDADGVNYAALDLVALLAEDTDVVKTTSARGIVEIRSFQTDGSALEDTVSNGNTVALRTRRGGSVVTTHWFDEDGDFGYNGSLISYDHLDDAAMARDLQLVLTGRRGVQYNQEAMVKAGILHPSEHGIMVSHKRMTALQLGAIRQGYEDRLALERRVKYLEKELKKWQ